MKKWMVALLGIFMVLGTCLFTACDTEKVNLTLSQENVNILIRSDEVGSGEQIVTADISGSKDYSIEVSANGYDEYIEVRKEKVSDSKTNIIIKGVSENDTPSVVTVKVAPGNIEKNIYVNVYSEIRHLSANTDTENDRNNFLVKGQTNLLNAESLLTIEPIKAQRDIVWTFDDQTEGAVIDGNNLVLPETFTLESVKLKATSQSTGVYTVIEVPVLDKIDESVNLKWSYSQNSSFETIAQAHDDFIIVPNLKTDEKYQGYVVVDYLGDLEINGYAVDRYGNVSQDIVVNRFGEYNGLPLFKVSSAQGMSNLNGNYKIAFKIGYKDYNYAYDTMATMPISISVREKVNKITVLPKDTSSLENNLQTLYTEYIDKDGATSYGQEFNISITPTTVIEASNKYAIFVTINSAVGQAITTDGSCPVEIWYRDSVNGNRWTQVIMTPSNNGYMIAANNYPTATTLYIKASDKLAQQSVENISLIFQSIDNPLISTSFNLRLVRSVDREDFVFENADFRIDSSANEGNVVMQKEFTLQGQTSIDGLYIINNSDAVKFDDIREIKSDQNSVTFRVTLTLMSSSYGITTLDSYNIAHRNGLVSEDFDIDIFLPLKDAIVKQDSGNNQSNSVTDEQYNDKTYLVSGVQTSSTELGLSSLMLKNDTTTPILYSYNSINNHHANAKVTAGFVDYVENDEITLEEFKNLVNIEGGVASLIHLAQNNINSSGIASFSNDYSNIITKGTGFTYAVLFFTGKGVQNVDENGNTTLVRIILIESYVSPNSMNVVPESDKNITLYSNDSLSSEDAELTRKSITIRFANPNVSYTDITNIEFSSQNSLMGRMSIVGDKETGYTVTWADGRYSLSNVAVTSDGISFNIEVVSTFGELAFYDTLDIHYVLRNSNNHKVYDIYLPISISIKNAQRVESLKWKNSDEDGLYYEVGDTSPQYILLETLPSNARNDSVNYIITDAEGGVLNSFVSVSDEISSNVLAINLSKTIKTGMTGYIYILPADAVYNNQIKYYYTEGGNEKEGNIVSSMLGQYKDSAEGLTYYDFLVKNAYFKSNATTSENVTNVEFSKILIKIKINVADGKSFEHSYRIYDAEGFTTIKPDLYYTVMNSIDLSDINYNSIDFAGGLQGSNAEVTIKMNGNSFASTLTETAEIRNISFTGSIVGDGFIAGVNYGKINNVTIDVDGINPSNLKVNTLYGGGLVGENYGEINSSSVLGLNIEGAALSTIGGFAGRNFGKIDNSKVEFYNLAVKGQENLYAVNKFSGNNVGGFVGVIEEGSKITNSYAYSYAQENIKVLVSTGAGYVGAFAAMASTSARPENTILDYSFAVVNVSTLFEGYDIDNTYVRATNFYAAYLDGANEYKVVWVDKYESNANFVFNGDKDFYAYVNNPNPDEDSSNPHLRGLMQDERVKSVDYNVQTVKDQNGYYKSVEVNNAQGIMFAYAVNGGVNGLNNSQINDLNKLNTISLANLVCENNINKNIVITSSDSAIVKVVGSSLQVLKVGDVVLTLSSKQDAKINKPILVSVKYALSDMVISWTNASGKINNVKENSTLTLQKTRSRDFVVTYNNPNVYLGTTADSFELKQNDTDLKVVYNPRDKTSVSYDKISTNSFKLTANDNSVLTEYEISPVIFENATLQDAITSAFKRTFSVQPVDGVISFGVSGQKLPITPSTKTSVKVEIKTTAQNDSVEPVIVLDGNELESKTTERDLNKIRYFLDRDVQEDKAILNAVIEKLDESENDGVYTYTFIVTFSVEEGYRASISQNYDFSVFFVSTSGNSSKDWNGEFTLALTRQEFTNIDVQTRKIKSSYFEREGINSFVEVHETDQNTAVLAPGNSAIMQININPAFAYFDHVDFTYSGASILQAVNMEIVEPYNDSSNKFVRRDVDGAIEMVGSSLRYTPTATEKERGAIYYKLWFNTTLDRDSTIKFVATFYESNGEYISHVNSFITVSYLTEPKITVDGSDTAYLAKGSYANIQIDVLEDQKVETVVLDGDNVKGISISSLTYSGLDEEKGINTYTATVYASVTADTDENGVFYLQAQVSRELNGSKEYKTSTATVVLVDFKISPEDINITGTYENNLTVWQNVPKSFNVEYNLIPEEYNATSDEESNKAVEELKAAREDFLKDEFYPAESDASDARYLINYIYNKETKEAEVQTLEDRLFYVINGYDYVNIKDTSVDSPIAFDYEDGKMIVTGIRISGPIELALLTYVSAGGYTATYEKRFTVTVKTFSEKDLPITISNASEFNDLNPENMDVIDPNDYILKNDIVLENYTPFNTSAIRSLDGNGFTIYIKSFNTTLEGTSTLNLALFNKVVTHKIEGEDVPTTLKNVRVNLYNGGQITVNVAQYKTIKIAGLAIENEGVITNCEVVSFYTTNGAMGELLLDTACTLHSKPTGINVNYVSGVNTTEKVYHDGNSNWTSQVAGFVISNSGSITNSRVGGDSVIMVGDEKLIKGEVSSYTYATEQKLDTFNIVGQGNIAGFVLENTGGYIASSFVKNVDMHNMSNSTSFYVAGFVGTNTSSILTSYVEGVESNEALLGDRYNKFAREGSSIKSEMGHIAGFIYSNSGNIKDSYSNILIANEQQANNVYLASGFVYTNEGVVENCYSASQILNSNFTQMNFTGAKDGVALNSGTYTNCYFFNKDYASQDDSNDTTTESRYDTGALLISSPNLAEFFYGFAIADGQSDGIWSIDEEKGITLIEANIVSVSHRYVLYVDDSFTGNTQEDDQGKYILPYATLTFVNSSLEMDTAVGGSYNPILIQDAEDWVDVTGLSTSTYDSAYFNNSSVWGNYRLVNNIDLSTIASSDSSVALPSSDKSFSGTLYGNGFKISGVSMTNSASDVAFGLFASIEKKGNKAPVVTNINFKVDQVVAGDTAMVGVLAGYIKDAIIINITFDFNETSSVTGLNFAGGLSGLAYGDNIIKNIILNNPTVTADRYSSDEIKDYFKLEDLRAFRINLRNNLNFNTTTQSTFFNSIKDYSYAGSVVGYIDNYSFDGLSFNYAQSENFSINNIRVNGIVKIQGQVAGGVFGLTGYQTNLRDVGLLVEGNTLENHSYILSTKHFAGGVIGQSFGSVNRVFAVHQKDTQDIIEDNMSAYYGGNSNVERGILNLFYTSNAKYSQKYIGGIIGYVGSGNMEVSYSKLNVTSPTADFAGGLIGGIDLEKANSYQAESDLSVLPCFTKYYINEAYATGDVRAKEFAGGLIGTIKGEGSRVTLMAVNAFNYFSLYDYETQTYLNLNNGQTNVSNNFRINSIVGKVFDSAGNEIEFTETNYNKIYTSYFQMLKAKGDESQKGSSSVPSVAVYENYNFGGHSVTMDLFTIKDAYANSSLEQLFTEETIYVITSANAYTNSGVGHTYTQEGFLNSGAWSQDNWGHPMEELFPEIRYKRSLGVLYLDCWNVKDVFDKIRGNNDRVIVRGQVSEGSEEYADIDLDKYCQTYGIDIDNLKIESYAGRIEGGLYKTTASNGKNDVKIIASGNFIASTAPGFSVDKLTVEYTTTKNNGVIGISMNAETQTAGLFINSEVIDSSISNLKIILKSRVNVFVTPGAVDKNIGILAPTFRNTNLNNIIITTIESLTSTDSILTIEGGESTTGDKEINAGLISGALIQSNTLSALQVSSINIETSSNFISISKNKANKFNVGSYFGKTLREDGSQQLRMSLSKLSKSSTENDYFAKIAINIIVDAKDNDVQVNVGGYVGYTQGLDYLTTQDSLSINNTIKFDISSTSKSKISILNVGGIFGVQEATSKISLSGHSSIIENKLKLEASVESLNVGSYAGIITGGAVKLANFQTFNLSMSDTDDPATPDQNSFDTSTYMSEQGVEISGDANIGVVVGKAESQFEFRGGTNSDTTLNSRNEPIKLTLNKKGEKTPSVNFGSVVGWTNAETSSESAKSLNIVNKIKSNAQVVVEGDGNVNLGGMVGYIQGQASTETSSNVQIGDETSMLRFDGAFYTNVKAVTVGGILGKYQQTKRALLNIQKTSFGGAVKVYGENSNASSFTFGGTVGDLLYSYASQASGINESEGLNIQSNYNYGDVFIEYDKNLTNIGEYIFGGLTGNLSIADETNCNIIGNYSLTTSHNSRMSTVDNSSANALFGQGCDPNQTSRINYYNHAVVLLNDDLGVDAAYNNAYDATGCGYNGLFNSRYSENIADIIYVQLGRPELISGHKLKPIGSESSGKLDQVYTDEDTENPYKFNGMTYYTINGEITNSGLYLYNESTKESSTDLNNIAIIGNANTIDYRIDSTFNSTNIHALVEQLSGHSYVSGLVLNANVQFEYGQAGEYYAPLVSKMVDNSIVYAVNVKGTIELGGSGAASVSGIVGNLISGKIFDCSTDIDIVYRAGNNGFASGIAFAEHTNNLIDDKLIENTYSTGSIKTLIASSVYAFASNSSDTVMKNCYTISKIDFNDYVSADSGSYTGDISNIKNSNSNNKNLYYDKDGFNYNTSGYKGENKSYTDFRKVQKDINQKDTKYSSVFGNKNTDWLSDVNFNYGYPTLKYNYMKTSSWATRTEIAQGSEGYDSKVLNGEFERLANGQEPQNTDNEFFFVPNAGVLANLANTTLGLGLDKNYALLYDIDLSNVSTTLFKTLGADADKDGKNAVNFTGKFDGRGKTISNLNAPMFYNIRGTEGNETDTYVRNLRLTDAHVEGNIKELKSALLAKTVTDATISNMTLSGFISGTGSDGTLGALVNSAIRSHIDTITNLVDIKTTAGLNVGGIAGQMFGGTISYSSNYGPITVQSEKNETVAVGGIVGSATGGSIDHSYNATSVLNNYAMGNSVITVKGMFKTGGIVGFATTDETYTTPTAIIGSYNSGMVKSGNKNNVSTREEGKIINGAYAGGIIGEGKATIDTCYNEGTIEALGDNPEFAWTWENNTDTGNVLALVLRQSNERNVWAYGIGTVDGTISSSHVRVSSTGYNDNIVVNNGAFGGNNDILKYWTWERIKNSAQITTDEIEKSVSASFFDCRWYFPFVHWANVDFHDLYYKITLVNPNAGEKAYVTVTSVNELEIPTAFILETFLNIHFKYEYLHWMTRDIFPDLNFNEQLNDNYNVSESYTDVESLSEASEDYYTNYLSKNVLTKNQHKFSNISIGENKVFTGDKASLVKNIINNTRSNYNTESKIIKIANAEYYVADSNNLDDIFNAGIYQYSDTITSNSLAYFNSVDKYKINATLAGNKINAKVDKVEKGEDGTTISYTISSSEEINGDLVVNVSVEHSEIIEFSNINLNYIYIDDYSIGLRSNMSAASFEGYVLTSQANLTTTYSKLVKISTKQYGKIFNGEDIQPEDNNQDLIYLGLKEKGVYVYIPNAVLKNNKTGQEFIVNNNTSVPNNLNEGNGFNANIETLINQFKNQKFYSRTISDDTALKNISFTNGGAGTLQFVGSDERENSVTISYGQEIENIFDSIEITETEVSKEETSTDENGEIITETIIGKKYTYIVSMKNPSQNVIGQNGFTSIIAYNTESGWNHAGYSDDDYQISVIDNTFVFETDDIYDKTYDSNIVKENIANYFSDLSFIANDFSNSKATINSSFENVVSRKESVNLGNAGKLDINVTVNKDWTYTNVYDLNITKDDSNNLSIALTQGNLNLNGIYALNGVVIYKGQINLIAKESYTSKVENYTITNKTGYSFYDVKLNSSSTDYEIEGFINTGELLNNNSNSGWNVTGDVTISATIFSTYQMDEKDSSPFNVVLKNNLGRSLYAETEIVKDTTDNNKFNIEGLSILQETSAGKIIKQEKSLVPANEIASGTDGHIPEHFEVNYSFKGIKFLTISYQGKDILNDYIRDVTLYFDQNGNALKTYYDENGNITETPNENNFVSGKKYTKTQYQSINNFYCVETDANNNVTARLTISKAEIISLDSFSTIEASLECIKLDSQYLLINPANYSYLPSWSYQEDNIDYNYNTAISSLFYVWKEFFMSDYQKYEKNINLTDDVWSKLVFEKAFINNVEFNDESRLPKQLNIDKINKKISIILDSIGGFDNIAIRYKLNNENTSAEDASNTKLNVSVTQKPLSIILTKDISFKERTMAFTKKAEVDIIGNGYSISYYGDSFYNTLYGEENKSSFIKEILFLGETINKSILISDKIEGTTTLQDVSLYGSVIDIDSKAAILGDEIKTKSIINNLNTYVAISSYSEFYGNYKNSDNLTKTASDPVTLFDTESLTSVSNYGTIIARRGYDGSSGANAKQSYGENGGNGGDGIAGGGIRATSAEEITKNIKNIENKGILHSGNGGNGGAGGSSYRGRDCDCKEELVSISAGTAGTAGAAGAAGELSGFNGESIAKQGFAGQSGAKARNGFGYINGQTVEVWYANHEEKRKNFIFYYDNKGAEHTIKDPGTIPADTIANNTFRFTIEGTAQVIPNDVWENKCTK